MKRRIQQLSHTLMLGLCIGIGSSCTPKLGNTIVEDNMMFAQLQLRVAFDEIDYARTNESPESREKREKTVGENSPTRVTPNRTAACISSRPRTGPAASFRENYGISTNIPRTTSGKRKHSSTPICWSRKK